MRILILRYKRIREGGGTGRREGVGEGKEGEGRQRRQDRSKGYRRMDKRRQSWRRTGVGRGDGEPVPRRNLNNVM
jgi:hypothetical protein